jgi:hypothetical protein
MPAHFAPVMKAQQSLLLDGFLAVEIMVALPLSISEMEPVRFKLLSLMKQSPAHYALSGVFRSRDPYVSALQEMRIQIFLQVRLKFSPPKLSSSVNLLRCHSQSTLVQRQRSARKSVFATVISTYVANVQREIFVFAHE